MPDPHTGGAAVVAEELATVFARMSGLLLAEETVNSTLNLVTSLAAETILGTTGAGLSLVEPSGERTSAAYTDPEVERADALQYDLDEGPCLTAWAQRQTVRIDDTRTEVRWPAWCLAADNLDVRAVLSAPLVTGAGALGAIKVYSDQPSAYDAHHERVLSMFAAQAAVLVANARAYADAESLSEQLREALQVRDLIGQAKGVLMERDGFDEETAFVALAVMAQEQGLVVSDAARALVASTSKRRP